MVDVKACLTGKKGDTRHGGALAHQVSTSENQRAAQSEKYGRRMRNAAMRSCCVWTTPQNMTEWDVLYVNFPVL